MTTKRHPSVGTYDRSMGRHTYIIFKTISIRFWSTLFYDYDSLTWYHNINLYYSELFTVNNQVVL